jgi:hypothetical protein
MVLNSELTQTLNAQETIPKILIGSASADTTSASVLTTTYVIESGGYLYVKVNLAGADLTAGSITVTATNTFQSQFQPSTTVSTTSMNGVTGLLVGAFVAQKPFPVDTVCVIKVSATASAATTVTYDFELSELITGIYR